MELVPDVENLLCKIVKGIGFKEDNLMDTFTDLALNCNYVFRDTANTITWVNSSAASSTWGAITTTADIGSNNISWYPNYEDEWPVMKLVEYPKENNEWDDLMELFKEPL